jgi:hypothetical protein
VTIKYGKGYEETWAVFNGQVEEVREDILGYFGVDRQTVEGLTLSELVVNVTNLAHGKGNAASILGGVVLGSKPTDPSPGPQADEAQQATGNDAWAQAEGSAPAADPNAALYTAIEAAADRAALKVLYAQNQAAFTDADLMTAWKAKGKSLPA